MRQQGASKQLQDALGGDVTVMQLDVADPASVAAFADTARGMVDHVDVLINNAGASRGRVCCMQAAGPAAAVQCCLFAVGPGRLQGGVPAGGTIFWPKLLPAS